MSACALSMATCSSAAISAGVRWASSPSSPRAARASPKGPSGISAVTRVSIPASAIRWSVAATSASSDVFSGGSGSGAALAASTPIPGLAAGGVATGLGDSAGLPAGGVDIASYSPLASLTCPSTGPETVSPADCASCVGSVASSWSSSSGRLFLIASRIRWTSSTISGLGAGRSPSSAASSSRARAAVSATGSVTAPRASAVF